ncbi:MAG: aconitase X catalytic domain-containing protein [Candidatus Methanomethylophilaceae archaeon]|nr:aconitase X catalytic domain-containing protein [Candidatus Methanomethylophilaceae archaeon]
MYLNREEESILQGERGPGLQKAMELLVALGKVYEADGLVPISSAHLSGASYKTIGEGGIAFLEDISRDVKVKVPSTLNPLGMDRERWSEMHVPEHFASRQLKIIDLYARMGVRTSCSCTPYTGENVPRFGDHVAWAESSALSFVNSMIGARTNREGGPGALAAALVGKTANYGLHMTENRRPTVIIEAQIEEDPFQYTLLGQAVGKAIGNGIPFFRGIRPDLECAKTLAAAMAASGAVAMFHVEGLTPEAVSQDVDGLERVSIGRDELRVAHDSLQQIEEPELLAFGCPHLTVKEMKEMAEFLRDKRKTKDVDIWFCTSREVREACPDEVAVLERFGPVLADTCMVVAPIETHYKNSGSNSAKAANYLPTLCSQKVRCDSFQRLMEAVL